MKQYSLAFVLPRYSASIGGGAETLVRDLAIKVKKELSHEVEIITTTARDNRTWAGYFEEGQSYEDGLIINRFNVDDRDLNSFVYLEQKMHNGYTLSIEEQISWIRNSVNSKSLYAYIDLNKNRFDLVFFAPYLFGTTFWGSLLTEKSILVPCLHDEAYAYLEIIRLMFRKAKGIMWNTSPEAELAKSLYRIDNLEQKGCEVGLGFDLVEVESQEKFKPKSYFLYCGRKESGKGLDVLLKYYAQLKLEKKTLPNLVLLGAGSIDFINELPQGVIDLGFVSETEKIQIMKDAICLFQPSVNESFSIVIMESWLQGTPVIVNSDCLVTNHHVEVSDGGLHYRSYEGFKDVVKRITEDQEVSKKLGLKGKDYVTSYYSWSSVLERFEKALRVWIN